MSPPPGRPSWRRQDGRLTMSHGLVGSRGISPGNGFRSHSSTLLYTGVIYVIASTVKITLWVEGTFSQRGAARKDVDLSHVLA